MAAIGARRALAVGYARNGALGIVEATTDGGATWRTRYAGPDVLRAVVFTDPRRGWAVGSTGILATTDGGVHWRLQRAVSSFYRFTAVAFADARHGWAVGGTGGAAMKPGFIMTTSDGGAHWTTLLPGTADRLNGVSFVDARRGWVVGNRGVVYHTSDGGRSWVISHVDIHWELGAVTFSDARHGWAIVHPHWSLGAASSGDSQRGWGLLRQLDLLATSDGGVTWTAVKTAGGLASPVILTAVTLSRPLQVGRPHTVAGRSSDGDRAARRRRLGGRGRRSREQPATLREQPATAFTTAADDPPDTSAAPCSGDRPPF